MSGQRLTFGAIYGAVRLGRAAALIALMALALPAPVAASGGGQGSLLTVLGPSSAQILGAAKVASGFGTVTSGFRSIAHNRRVGGVPTSYHLVGRAIDVERRRGITHQMIVIALQQAGFVLVESLDERDHSHFAFANALPYPAIGPLTGIVPVILPDKPRGPHVLADDHGVLIVDSPSLATLGQPQR